MEATRRNGRRSTPIIDWRYTMLGSGGPGGYTDYTPPEVGSPEAGGPGSPFPYDPGGPLPGDAGGPTPYMPPPLEPEVGRLFWLNVNSPAAGQDLEYIHSDYDFPVTVLNFFFLLVTSAAAGNRTGAVGVLGGNQQPLMTHYTNISQAGSIRSYWQFNPWFPSNSGSTHSFSIGGTTYGQRQNFIPEVILEPYQRLRTLFNWQSAGLDASDQINNGALLLRREKQ